MEDAQQPKRESKLEIDPLPQEADEGAMNDDEMIHRVVTWAEPKDPANPRCWSSRKKWTNVILISCQATLSPIASTLLAVADVEIGKDFRLESTYTPALPVAMFLLGLGLGPLYLAPCSELYGRRIVYITSYTLFTILNVGCALAPNITVLSILRLLSGMAGSAGPSLGGGSIGDMFAREDRGRAQALYGFGPTTGPVLGGVIGGFVVAGTGSWRWLMWIMVIAPGLTVLASIAFLRESYGPFLLERRAKRLRRETGDDRWRTTHQPRARELFSHAITRPLRMLCFAPICTVMSLYMALICGILYLHLVTISLLFGPSELYGLFSYRWTHGTTGLAYLGAGAGSLLGTILCAAFLNRSYAWMVAHKANRVSSDARPEFRMPLMQLGVLTVPVGLTIFAWTAQNQTHWALPLLGAAIFAIGLLIAYVCIQTYLVDAFEHFAASALAAAVLSRSVVGCIFSLVGFQLYKSLGYAWGTMLLAFCSAAMIPTPLLLYIYGPRLRAENIQF